MGSLAGRTFHARLSQRNVRRATATPDVSSEDEGVQLREDVPLAPYTTLGLGGKARYFVECGTEDEVRTALAYAGDRRLPVYVLGGGSNVVFLDAGFPGLVLRVTIGGIEFRDGPSPEVCAGAGVDWDTAVQGVVERGWTGVECLSGIPGTVGGTPIQNVGAYGQEIAETVVSVVCLDRATLERRTFTAADCAFGYRDSRFKRGDRDRYVVLEVTLRLARNTPPRVRYPELRDAVARGAALDVLPPAGGVRLVRAAVLTLRRGKSMVLDPADPNTRSAGSFFTNPVLPAAAFADLGARWTAMGRTAPIPAYPADGGMKVPAAWLVEQAGFPKGYRQGGVGISTRHALALVNLGGTSVELLALAEAVADGVYERFGIRLAYEPEVVSPCVPPPSRSPR
ncbi:MAG TPA: UDP-N-acetylmuramate dehydrogenase [Gemmatimonadales bacterium]|nr:UDP-N-acetylmuramate dehydrogenase [Gemmatimonadales bacterium]